MKKHFPITALLSVFLVAGCINFGGTSEANVDIKDIISVAAQSASVIPIPPLSTETDFTLSFQVKNNDKNKNIQVNLNVFDWGVCSKPEIKGTQNADKTIYNFQLVPGQTELVEISTKSPTKEKIQSLKASCPIQWRTTYAFTATSGDGFNVVSKDKLTQLQRAGKSPELPAITKSIGTGPIRIYFDFKTDKNYMTAASPLQMTVTAKDEGEGSLSKVAAGKLFIKVPVEWTRVSKDAASKDDSCTSDFQIDRTKSTQDTIAYVNKKDIPLIERSTPELVCNFAAPNLDAFSPIVPQKSYSVSAELVDYTYSIDGKKEIEINP
ncbi:MAG TPA: hypothetical protein VI933_05055 [archaeon]|nr:hypothetical protein [archaeon]